MWFYSKSIRGRLFSWLFKDSSKSSTEKSDNNKNTQKKTVTKKEEA